MNIITINNIKYIIEKDHDESIKSFNIRSDYILKKNPLSELDLDDVVFESYIYYYNKYLNCQYN